MGKRKNGEIKSYLDVKICDVEVGVTSAFV